MYRRLSWQIAYEDFISLKGELLPKPKLSVFCARVALICCCCCCCGYVPHGFFFFFFFFFFISFHFICQIKKHQTLHKTVIILHWKNKIKWPNPCWRSRQHTFQVQDRTRNNKTRWTSSRDSQVVTKSLSEWLNLWVHHGQKQWKTLGMVYRLLQERWESLKHIITYKHSNSTKILNCCLKEVDREDLEEVGQNKQEIY